MEVCLNGEWIPIKIETYWNVNFSACSVSSLVSALK